MCEPKNNPSLCQTMFSRYFPCCSRIYNKENDGISEVFQRQTSTNKGDNNFNDSLKSNFNSIRGRRNHIRNIPITILPTSHDDDPSSEDENGEPVPIINHGLFAGQDFKRIRAWCLKNQQLFVDPMFPPTNQSLFSKSDPCQFLQGAKDIIWKRGIDICEHPNFFVDGASRFDIMQGELGDCWLLAAMANLTLHNKLLEKVIPPCQGFNEKYAGIFHFR